MASKLAGKRGKKPRGAPCIPPDDLDVAAEVNQVATPALDETLAPGDDDSSGEELDTRSIVEEAIR